MKEDEIIKKLSKKYKNKSPTIDKTYGGHFYSYNLRDNTITVIDIDTDKVVWKGDPYKFKKLVGSHDFLKVLDNFVFLPQTKRKKIRRMV